MRFVTFGRTPKLIAMAAGAALLAASLGASTATTAAAAPITGPHTWQLDTVEGTSDWTSTASSSDGTRLVATERVGDAGDFTNPDGSRTAGCAIWVSADSGQNWVEETTIAGRVGTCHVVSSGDGVHMAATVDDGTNGRLVVTSSDSGETWAEHPTALPEGWWIDIAMSKDGSHLWAVPGYANGPGLPQATIYKSDDYGVTWHSIPTLGIEFRSIAASADGQHLIAYNESGVVTSSDGGDSWTSTLDGAGQIGTNGDVSTSASGQYSMIAGATVENSSDYGQTWTQQNAGPAGGSIYLATAISADGQVQVTQNGCYLDTSTDAGSTWTTQSLGTDCASWSQIAITDDGSHFLATSQDGQGYNELTIGTIAAQTQQYKYVALGDSFQSGEGAYGYETGTDTATNSCHRSDYAYPHQLVNTQEVALTLDFRACSGAKILDMLRSNGSPKADGPAQIDALDANTRLVTVGIVGNDLDFGGTVANCVQFDLISEAVGDFELSCAPLYNKGVQAKITSLQSGQLRTNLSLLYRIIRTKAPHARVVVVSYPKFFPAKGVAEWDGLPGCSYLRPSDQVWMNSMVARADTAIGNAAKAAGFEYANMVDVTAGHEQCTDFAAMNGIVGPLTSPASESFHPNTAGHILMTAQIERTLGSPVVPTFSINPNQTVTKTVAVTGTSFHVNVAWPGSDVETTLVSPSGKVYSRDNPQDATHDNGPTYEYYDIANPEPGTWTISSYGLDVAPGGEPVTLTTLDEQTPNAVPTAVVAVSGAGPTYTFDASGSADSDGSIADYEWDFGDGTIGSGAVTQHTYAAAGTYLATLVTTDNQGGQGFGAASTTLTVGTPSLALYSGGATSLTNNYLSLGSASTTYINGTFSCTSSVHIQGSLIVTGDAHLTNHCEVDGDLTVGGAVTADSTPIVGGNLTVGGNVKFQSTAHVGGNIVAGGTFTSTDGLTTAAIIAKGSVGGSISSLASVPAIPAVTLPSVAVNSAGWAGFGQETWQQWMNATAHTNGAPSWSHGLTGSPGCTMASYGDSVNGTAASITTSTVIDATKATTGCATVSLQGMTLTLKADLVIYADAFSSINGITVLSGDGLPHTLRILVPGTGAACTSAHTINLSSGTSIDPLIGTRLYAPGKVTLTGAVSLHGEVQAGCVSQSGATALTYASVPTPGLDP